MNIYQQVSVAVALTLYGPLAYQLLKGKTEQNLASYILWGSLDAIAGASMLVQGSQNYQLPFAYVLGCIVIISCILKSGKYNWTKVETTVSISVLLSSVAWAIMVFKFQNPWLATILSTTGVVLAGIPQLKDSWLRPKDSPFMIYIGFTFVNVMSVLGGASWTVEERFYSSSCVVLCGAVVVASARKFRR